MSIASEKWPPGSRYDWREYCDRLAESFPVPRTNFEIWLDEMTDGGGFFAEWMSHLSDQSGADLFDLLCHSAVPDWQPASEFLPRLLTDGDLDFAQTVAASFLIHLFDAGVDKTKVAIDPFWMDDRDMVSRIEHPMICFVGQPGGPVSIEVEFFEEGAVQWARRYPWARRHSACLAEPNVMERVFDFLAEHGWCPM